MRILFICTGNTCRSPMAQAIAQDLYPHWEFDSAGLAAFGDPIANHAKRALARVGLSLENHISKPLDDALAAWADVILTMTISQKKEVAARYPNARVYTVTEMATGRDGDIADPFGRELGVYQKTLKEIQVKLEELKEWDR